MAHPQVARPLSEPRTSESQGLEGPAQGRASVSHLPNGLGGHPASIPSGREGNEDRERGGAAGQVCRLWLVSTQGAAGAIRGVELASPPAGDVRWLSFSQKAPPSACWDWAGGDSAPPSLRCRGRELGIGSCRPPSSEPAAPAQWHVLATPTAAPSRVPWVQFPAVHVTCELPESLHRSPDGCRVPVPCPRGRLMGTPWPRVPGNQHQPIPWKAPRAAAPGLPAEALQPTREPAVTGAGPQGSGQGPAGRGGIRAPLAARPPSGFYLPSPARPNFKGRPARPLPLPWPCGKAPGRPASSPALWSPREQLGTHPAPRAPTPMSRATRCAPSTHTAFAWAAPSTVPLHSLLPQTRGTPKLLPPGSWSPHLCI